MIELYINDIKADIADEKILLSKKLIDYTNPTAIKNSLSKTIELLSTTNNELIFDSLSPDSKVLNFNPSKKNKFKIFRDGDLIETGYIKLESIIYDKHKKYSITLFGEIGSLLYNITYDEEGNKYTLEDVDFGFTGLTINKDTIFNAWVQLDKLDQSSSVYNTINFAPTYDGVPECNSFDPKKCWIMTNKYESGVENFEYNGKKNERLPNSFDSSGNPDTGTGKYFPITYKNPDGVLVNFCLAELPEAALPFEMKDYRSYLQRPVVRLKYLLINILKFAGKFGYTYSLNADLFNTDLWNKSWMTLNPLWKTNPNICSNEFVSQKDFFKKTDSPADYLISLCKSFGLYLEIDTIFKVIHIKDRKHFYIDNTEELFFQDGKITLKPLNFAKNKYLLNFKEGQDDFTKSYKEETGKKYGQKTIITGYQFDNASEELIQNNIFQTCADASYISHYCRFCSIPKPFATGEEINVKYFPFNYNESNESYDIAVKWPQSNQSVTTFTTMPITNFSGAAFGIFYDNKIEAKLDNDRKYAESKNVILFSGNIYNRQIYEVTQGLLFETNDTEIDKIGKLRKTPIIKVEESYITDDYNIEYSDYKGCYFSLDPGSFDIKSGYEFARKITNVPTFTRNYYEIFRKTLVSDSVYKENDWKGQNGTIDPNGYITFMYTHTNTLNGGPYKEYTDTTLNNDHKYALIAIVRVNNHNNLTNKYLSFRNYTPTDYVELNESNHFKIIASYYENLNGGLPTTDKKIRCLTTSTPNTRIDCGSFKFIDLTDAGFSEKINSAQDIIDVFGATKGNELLCKKANDFGIPDYTQMKVIFDDESTDLFDRHYSYYIKDLYSVNTTTISGKVYIKNINDALKHFWWFDGSIWVLSEYKDYDPETFICTATFIKVNDKENYLK